MSKHTSVLSSLRCLNRTSHHSYSSLQGHSSIGNLLQSQTSRADVTVHGLIRSIRRQKTRSFLAIGDGTSLAPLQALLTPDQADSLSTGAAVQLTGKWVPSPNDTLQSHELHVETVRIIGAADPATFPLQKKYHTPEYLRTIPHLRARTPFNSLLLRFRSQSIARITKFFADNEFTQTHPPILTSSDCEGAGEAFGVGTGSAQTADVSDPAQQRSESHAGGFFRSPKFLTVSSQLHLEALAQSVGKVWTLSPTFRAETSSTPRHLSEFYMLEAEVNFVERLDDVMSTVESMLRDLTTGLVATKVGEEIVYGKRGEERGMQPASERIEKRWRGLMRATWPRITYADAIDLLQRSAVPFEHPPRRGQALQAEHERYIAANVGEGGPVFVTQYPRAIKPFYMLPSAAPGADGAAQTAECFDLLVPETGEIAGGSLREHRLPRLLEAMRENGLGCRDAAGEESFGRLAWYVDLRRWGSAPHGGFGLGFDRTLGYLAGVPNIKEVVAFPRWYGRCEC